MKPEYQKRCIDAGLDAPVSFWAATEDEIAASYNGCGPEKFSAVQDEIVSILTRTSKPDETLRAILTEIFDLFELGFVIHDWDFSSGLKSETDFHEANKRLYVNMSRLLSAAYPAWAFWAWTRRARWWLKMQLVYKAVSSDAGLDAFNKGRERAAIIQQQKELMP